MMRNVVNLIVDAVTAVTALGLVVTGLLIYFVLPPGRGQGRATVLGWNRHDWGDVHFWIAMAVLALVLVHVLLHWQWVCKMVCRVCGCSAIGPRARNLWACAVILAIAAGIGGLLFAANAIKQDAPPRSGEHRDEDNREQGGRHKRRGWQGDQPTGMLLRSRDTAWGITSSARST